MNSAISNKIKVSFNRASETYDQHCCVQKDTAAALFSAIYSYGGKYNRIADFACGTGVSTKFIISLFNFKKIYAIDFAERLLAVAQTKLSHDSIEWIVSDYNKKLFSDRSLSLIVCNLGLQWSLDLSHTMQLFHHYLEKNGMLAFSMPLAGTLHEIKPLYRNYNYRHNEVISMLQQSHFELYEFNRVFIVKNFASAIEAVKSIKAVGANCSNGQHAESLRHDLIGKGKIKNVFFNTNDITLTYNVGIFLVKKK